MAKKKTIATKLVVRKKDIQRLPWFKAMQSSQWEQEDVTRNARCELELALTTLANSADGIVLQAEMSSRGQRSVDIFSPEISIYAFHDLARKASLLRDRLRRLSVAVGYLRPKSSKEQSEESFQDKAIRRAAMANHGDRAIVNRMNGTGWCDLDWDPFKKDGSK